MWTRSWRLPERKLTSVWQLTERGLLTSGLGQHIYAGYVCVCVWVCETKSLSTQSERYHTPAHSRTHSDRVLDFRDSDLCWRWLRGPLSHTVATARPFGAGLYRDKNAHILSGSARVCVCVWVCVTLAKHHSDRQRGGWGGGVPSASSVVRLILLKYVHFCNQPAANTCNGIYTHIHTYTSAAHAVYVSKSSVYAIWAAAAPPSSDRQMPRIAHPPQRESECLLWLLLWHRISVRCVVRVEHKCGRPIWCDMWQFSHTKINNRKA